MRDMVSRIMRYAIGGSVLTLYVSQNAQKDHPFIEALFDDAQANIYCFVCDGLYDCYI